MKKTSREYLSSIMFSPQETDIGNAFVWGLTKEGAKYWEDRYGFVLARSLHTKQSRRKFRQLRKTAFRLGYRNAMSYNWRP